MIGFCKIEQFFFNLPPPLSQKLGTGAPIPTTFFSSTL